MEAILALARAVFDVRPLVNALDPPIRVAWRASDDVGEAALRAIASHLDVAPLTICPGAVPSDLTVLEQCISERLLKACEVERGLNAASTAADVDRAVDEALQRLAGETYPPLLVRAPDGALLTAYAAGSPASPPVVIASACAMPVHLCHRWMRTLADDFFVITWEGRGLFGEGATLECPACDCAAQAADLEALMDRFGLGRAHVMGVCGGAVVALLAAARCPARIASLSLWHGDYELGADCPKTTHQQSVRTLLSLAAQDRRSAASMRTLFCESVRAATTRAARTGVRWDLAHLLLYPLANTELLFRYARLNGSIMATDVRGVLPRVHHPTLVVTSKDDETAHPEGSMRIAAALPNATLHVASHGDHLSVFDAPPALTQLARAFISHDSRALADSIENVSPVG